MKKKDSVRVVCRFRPMNSLEKKKKSKIAVKFKDEKTIIHHGDDGRSPHPFNFDYIFDMSTKQEKVYKHVGAHVVDYLFKGYNGTIFAYGQTGSGKTFTMMGPNDDGSGYCDDESLKGLIPRIIDNIFSTVQSMDENVEFLIQVSYVEIYNEKIRDLLNPKPSGQNLQIREEKGGRGIYVDGATQVYCGCETDVFDLMKTGAKYRVVTSHTMNSVSSRSHAVFILEMTQKHLTKGETKAAKLFLVDLAGSESVKKTGAKGDTLNQAKYINKSLSALGGVINSLTDGKKRHIPYRDSKLTRLLQDSLGGNSKTFLIINCSPSSYNSVETLSTLRFGKRAKSIKNSAKVNKELDAKTLRIMLEKAQITIKSQKKYIKALEHQLKSEGGDLEKLKNIHIDYKAIGMERDDNEKNVSNPVMELKKQNEQLEKKLEENKELVSMLEESKEKLREDLFTAKEKLEKRLEFCKMLEKELGENKDMRGENLKLENEVNSLKASLEKVSFEKNEQGVIIENLRKTLEETQEKLEKAQTKFPTSGDDLVKAYEDEPPLDIVPDPEILIEEEEEESIKPEEKENEKKENDIKNKSIILSDCEDVEELVMFSRKEPEKTIHVENDQSINEDEEVTEKEGEIEQSSPEKENLQNKEYIMKIEKENNTITKENQRLKETLRITRGNAEKVKTHLEKQKVALMRDLRNRCDKVIELEMLLDEIKDKYEHVLYLAQKKDSSKKILLLEKNLKKLNLSHQKFQGENSTLKLKIKMLENKLKIRNERIKNLEKSLEDVIDKNTQQTDRHIRDRSNLLKESDRQKKEIQNLKLMIESMQNEEISRRNRVRVPISLRGGGIQSPNYKKERRSSISVVNGSSTKTEKKKKKNYTIAKNR